MKEDIISANESLNKWCNTQGINYYEGIEALGYLFRYAVPKLYEQGYYYEIIQWNNSQHKAIINERTSEWAVTAATAVSRTPALALFWVIRHIIDKSTHYTN